MVHTILFQHLLESLSTPQNFLLKAMMEHSLVSEFKMIMIPFFKVPPELFGSLHKVCASTLSHCHLVQTKYHLLTQSPMLYV